MGDGGGSGLILSVVLCEVLKMRHNHGTGSQEGLKKIYFPPSEKRLTLEVKFFKQTSNKRNICFICLSL